MLFGSSTIPAIAVNNSPPCAQSIEFDPSGNLFFTVPNGYQIIEASESSGYATLTTVATGTRATLNANRGGSVNPDRSIVIASPPSGRGTAQEALAIDAGQVYVAYSFLNGSTGYLAAFALPGLTQTATTQQPAGSAVATGMAIVP